MREHQEDSRSERRDSYEGSGNSDGNNVSFESASIPRTNSRLNGYNTLRRFSDDSDNLRSRSVSVPYLACSARTVKRSWSTLDSQGNSERTKNLKAKSLGNINDSGDASVEISSSTEMDDNTRDAFCCGYSKRQFKCGIALCLLSISDVMGFGIFAPFFPVVAEQKNLSEIEIGLVFASFSMAGIFASIFTGTLLVRVGAKFIILAGMFWSAGATICLGVLDRVPSEYFFFLCCACRVLMGIGSAASFTALFAVIFQEFSDRALTMIGISESLCSIGGIIGPLIGGGLYDVGGYITPFIFLGGMQFIVLFACAILLPHVAVERQVNAVSPAWLLLNLHGLFSSLFVILSFAVNSFITANISLFLSHYFGVSSFMIGVFMLVFSIFYGISTPIWGYIAESRNLGAHMMTLGCFLGGIVLTLFGPADVWMNLFGWTEPHKWLVFVTTGLMGVTMGALIMPTFGEMLVAAKQMKLQQNELAEYGLVSGLWNTVFSVGDIMGPTVGGLMVQKISFQNAMGIFGITMVILSLLKTIHLVYLGWKKRRSPTDSEVAEDDGERKSLLSPDSPSVQI